jgi:hypothetical protein
MNSEMNPSGANGSEGEAHLASITLQQEAVQSMRHCLHELANVFTGVMIAGDLLSLQLTAGSAAKPRSSFAMAVPWWATKGFDG